MRTILLIITLAFLGNNTSAQIFNAGFEDNNGTPLSEWTIINADQNPVEDWMPVPEFNEEGWIQFYDFYDNKIAFSTSFYMNGEAANDWLISPSISIPSEGNPTLYWKAKSYDHSAPEMYAIKISTTDQQMESFTDLLVIEAEQAYEFNSRTLDLSAYLGQDIYIAFVNQTPYGYFLALDDVYISNSANCYGPSVGTFNSMLDIGDYAAGNSEEIAFEVSWDAVAGVEHYDVGVTTFTVPVTSDGVQTSTTKRYENVNFGTRYQMFVKNADCGSGWMGPKSIFTPSKLPYQHGFEPSLENYGEYDSDGWASDTWLMGINENVAYEGEGYMYSNTSTSATSNKWLYSYPLVLRENEPIKITFQTGYSTDSFTPGVLRIGLTSSNEYGTEPTDYIEIQVAPAQYQEVEIMLNDHTEGLKYIAFGNVTPPTDDIFSLRIDNFKVEAGNLSTQENILKNDIKIYPNPVKDQLNIDATKNLVKIEVYSIEGKLIKSIPQNSKNIQLNMNDLVKGIYILKMYTMDGFQTEKIIKH